MKQEPRIYHPSTGKTRAKNQILIWYILSKKQKPPKTFKS